MLYHNVEASGAFYSRTSSERPLPSFTAQRLALLPTARRHRVGIDLSYGIQEHQRVMAALCKNPLLERSLLQEIDEQTREETKRIIEQGNISCDALIVGTGPAGVSSASRIRELLPNSRLLMVDEREHRGGQFADEGYNYLLNTPRTGKKLGFPGELKPIHNLGSGAFLQLTDITDEEEYSPRKKLATCLKVNSFVASPALVGVTIDSIEITGDPDIPYITHATNNTTGEQFDIHPKTIVLARGIGKPKYGIDITIPETQEALTQRKENIYIAEAFNNHIDRLLPETLFREIQNGLVFVGAGDSTNTALDGILSKLLTRFTPDEIKTLRIDVYGAKYTGASDFEATVRIPRYNGLIPYIGTLIRPHPEKVDHLLPAGNNSVGVATENSLGIYKTVAVMAGYSSVPMEQVVTKSNEGGVHVVHVVGDGELGDEIIAQQIEGENIFSVGIDVKEYFPGRPPVFTRSIVRFTPRILATAEKVAAILDSSDDSSNN